jgi:hypothetical protein
MKRKKDMPCSQLSKGAKTTQSAQEALWARGLPLPAAQNLLVIEGQDVSRTAQTTHIIGKSIQPTASPVDNSWDKWGGPKFFAMSSWVAWLTAVLREDSGQVTQDIRIRMIRMSPMPGMRLRMVAQKGSFVAKAGRLLARWWPRVASRDSASDMTGRIIGFVANFDLAGKIPKIGYQSFND